VRSRLFDQANYQSTTVHIPPALASENLDIIPNAHAREVIVGDDGKAKASSSSTRQRVRRSASPASRHPRRRRMRNRPHPA
jgi:hypothetical protein